jgi:hypothetical protein
MRFLGGGRVEGQYEFMSISFKGLRESGQGTRSMTNRERREGISLNRDAFFEALLRRYEMSAFSPKLTGWISSDHSRFYVHGFRWVPCDEDYICDVYGVHTVSLC